MNEPAKNAMTSTVDQLELMAAAAAQTIKLLQSQIAAIKQGLATADATSSTATPSTSEDTNERDYSKWLLDGKLYSKGRFPLTVFEKYVQGKYTLAELEELFEPDKIYKQQIRGNKIVFKSLSSIPESDKKRFHKDEITTKDKHKIRITNQVGMKNFPQLMSYMAHLFAFPIKGHDAKRVVWEKEKQLKPPFTEDNVDFV